MAELTQGVIDEATKEYVDELIAAVTRTLNNLNSATASNTKSIQNLTEAVRLLAPTQEENI